MQFNYLFLFISIFLFTLSCKEIKQSTESAITEDKSQSNYINTYSGNRIDQSDDYWKGELDENEYYILRDKGTERSFSGDLWDHKEDGIYTCRGCALELFSSATKFKSGTGWPSFFQPLVGSHIATDTDYLLGYPRTEILCARCEGHLGHVFNDGPEPTGLRYCLNSASLDFIAEETKP